MLRTGFEPLVPTSLITTPQWTGRVGVRTSAVTQARNSPQTDRRTSSDNPQRSNRRSGGQNMRRTVPVGTKSNRAALDKQQQSSQRVTEAEAQVTRIFREASETIQSSDTPAADVLRMLSAAEAAAAPLGPTRKLAVLAAALCTLQPRQPSVDLDVHSIAKPYVDLYVRQLALWHRSRRQQRTEPGSSPSNRALVAGGTPLPSGMELSSVLELWSALVGCSFPTSHRMLDRLARHVLSQLPGASAENLACALACTLRYGYEPLHGDLAEALSNALLALPPASLPAPAAQAVLAAGRRPGKALAPDLVDHLALATLHHIGEEELLQLTRTWNLLLHYDDNPLKGRFARAVMGELWRQLGQADGNVLAYVLLAMERTNDRLGIPPLEATAARLKQLAQSNAQSHDLSADALATCLWVFGRLRWYMPPPTRSGAQRLAAQHPEDDMDVRGPMWGPFVSGKDGEGIIRDHLSAGRELRQLAARHGDSEQINNSTKTNSSLMANSSALPSNAIASPATQLDHESVLAFLERTRAQREMQAAQVAGDVVAATKGIVVAIRRKYGLENTDQPGVRGPPSEPLLSESQRETMLLESSARALANAILCRDRLPGRLPPRVERVCSNESWPHIIITDPLTGITSYLPHYTPEILEYRPDWERPAWLDERLDGPAPASYWVVAGNEDGGSKPMGAYRSGESTERLPPLLGVELEEDELEVYSEEESMTSMTKDLLLEVEDDEEQEEEEEEEDDGNTELEDGMAAGSRGVMNALTLPTTTPSRVLSPSRLPSERPRPAHESGLNEGISSTNGTQSTQWRLAAAEELLAMRSLDRISKSTYALWTQAPRLSIEDATADLGERASELSWQGIGRALEAMSLHSLPDAALLNTVQKRLEAEMSSVGTNHLTRFLAVCASLQSSPGEAFFEAVISEISQRLVRDEAKVSHLIMVLWSMATLDALSPARWQEILEMTPEIQEPSHVGNHGRLLQIALYLEMETGKSYRSFLPPQVLSEVIAASRQDSSTVSFLQRDILASLSSLGLEMELEAKVIDGLLSVDCAVVGKHADKRMAIEVDGPLHFAPRPPFKPLTHTIFRNRLLQYHGWTVISVPYYEWVPLRSVAAKQAYLRKRLGPVLSS